MKRQTPFPALFRLPPWTSKLAHSHRRLFPTETDRMHFVITLASMNVAHGTGGPFAAAVFETQSGRLVAIGMNLVVSTNCSLAHAELVALANAQQTLHSFDLGASNMPKHDLVTSSEPCAMCFGAIPWSGVRRVLCGARASDAEAIGFDEGPKPKAWMAALRRRGVTVVRDLCRAEAVAVLQEYKRTSGIIYNARKPAQRP